MSRCSLASNRLSCASCRFGFTKGIGEAQGEFDCRRVPFLESLFDDGVCYLLFIVGKSVGTCTYGCSVCLDAVADRLLDGTDCGNSGNLRM